MNKIQAIPAHTDNMVKMTNIKANASKILKLYV